MTIPLDLFNLSTVEHVQVGYEQRKRIKLTETESVCLDAVFSTGLKPNQTVNKLMRSTPCPADSLHWIVTYYLYKTSQRWYTHMWIGERQRQVIRWTRDTSMVPVIQNDMGPDTAAILYAHLNQDIWVYPETWSHKPPYRTVCYELLRDAMPMHKRVYDLIRLLSGHLPPCPGHPTTDMEAAENLRYQADEDTDETEDTE